MNIQHDIAKAKEARSKALNQMASLVNGKQSEESRNLYKTLEQDVKNYDETISMLLQIAENTTDEERAAAQRQAEETRNAIAAIPNQIVSALVKPDLTKRQFEVFKRGTLLPLSKLTPAEQQEYRDITTPTTNGGQDLISQSFSTAILNASRTYGPIAGLVSKQTGSILKQPLSNALAVKYLAVNPEGTTTVVEPAANGSNAFSQTPVVSSNVNQVSSIVASVIASRQEFADADNLTEYLNQGVFAEALAAGVESVLTTGLDQAGNAVQGASTNLLSFAGASTGYQTTSLANGIKYTDFISLFESIASNASFAYISPENPDARIFLHPLTKLYLQGQLDGFGRPFYSLDAQGNLVAIAGVKIAVNNAMSPWTSGSANQVVAVAGDIKKALVYQDQGSRLYLQHERFIDQNLVGFVAEHRIGVLKGVAGAVATLKLAAS